MLWGQQEVPYPAPRCPRRSCGWCGRWSRPRGKLHTDPPLRGSRSRSHSPRSAREPRQPLSSTPSPSQHRLHHLQCIHRILGCFGSEGTLRTVQFQPPCHGQDTSPETRLLQAPSSQAWAVLCLLKATPGAGTACPTHPRGSGVLSKRGMAKGLVSARHGGHAEHPRVGPAPSRALPVSPQPTLQMPLMQTSRLLSLS